MVQGVKTGGGVGGATPLRRDNAATTAGGFSVAGEASPAAPNARSVAVAGIGLETMLALQAVDEAEEFDRAAHRRGTAMLAALTHLQRMMLTSDDPAQVLRVLNDLASDGPLPADPGLHAILRSVILRARVELARREQSA